LDSRQFTVWQWTPAAATSHRIRGIGGLAAASMLLNAGWLLVTQVGWLPASVAVIVALLAVLLVLNQRLTARAPANTVERVVVDATFGLYLGWVSVATFANIAAVVTDPDHRPDLRTRASGRGRDPADRRRRRSPAVPAARRPRGARRRHGVGPCLDRDRPVHR
jgi:hypothetical protein